MRGVDVSDPSGTVGLHVGGRKGDSQAYFKPAQQRRAIEEVVPSALQCVERDGESALQEQRRRESGGLLQWQTQKGVASLRRVRG